MSIQLVMHPTISSSVIPFTCLQSFSASGYFSMSQFFTLGGQNIGDSASASVLPKNFQGWFPLGWTGWSSVQSKGLSRVFSNMTVQKHQFFSAQLSLWSNSHIHTWLLENYSFDYTDLCWQSNVSAFYFILCIYLFFYWKVFDFISKIKYYNRTFTCIYKKKCSSWIYRSEVSLSLVPLSEQWADVFERLPSLPHPKCPTAPSPIQVAVSI